MDSLIMGYERKRKKKLSGKDSRQAKKILVLHFMKKKGLLISKIPDLRIYT